MKIILSIFSLFLLWSCSLKQTNSIKPIINDSINLFAFVGKKISVTEFDPNENKIEKIIDAETGDTIITERYVMDYGFKCKYLVIINIYNKLNKDTIEFIAYDHYGRPGFENYDTVLLYISKSENGDYYFHRKYQFDEIFKNKKGYYYTYPKFLGTMYTPYKDSLSGFDIDLKQKKFPIGHLSKETLIQYYPKEFYKIEDSTAYPIRGISLEEMIKYRLKTNFRNLK